MYQPGHKGYKKKGCKHKRTKLLAPLIDQLELHQFDVVEEVINLYPKLMPNEQALFLIKFLEYIFPKKREITIEQAQETLIRDLNAKGIVIDTTHKHVQEFKDATEAPPPT